MQSSWHYMFKARESGTKPSVSKIALWMGGRSNQICIPAAWRTQPPTAPTYPNDLSSSPKGSEIVGFWKADMASCVLHHPWPPLFQRRKSSVQNKHTTVEELNIYGVQKIRGKYWPQNVIGKLLSFWDGKFLRRYVLVSGSVCVCVRTVN